MTDVLVALVRERAGGRCEYRRLALVHSSIPFEIDHIISRKHGGATVPENLALSCFCCNSAKGPNIAGLDPESGSLSALFNPRLQSWSQHFEWQGPILRGITPIGRTTIMVLAINEPDQIALRVALTEEGVFPPE